MELQKKLALLRKERGLTQLELAEEMDVSRQAVSRWETGLSIPTTENLAHLSRLYQVPVEYLLNGEPERPLREEPLPEAGETTAAPRAVGSWKWRFAAACAAAALVLFLLGVHVGRSMENAYGEDGIIHRALDEMVGEEVDTSSAKTFDLETGW